ncbi:Cytochrome P450 [Sinosporangium album]|uniref:Cytochrome P450 n=1 Tax=Sinosporangium album TaxID=504805 RepID=A0A1G8HYR4_9ACTN|nr:cytochrome P450 [Sinosporangium album]SDI11773.1 Cytochrome P450 [Sinosporangium album]
MNDVVRNYPFRRATPLEAPAEWDELYDACPVAPIRLVSGDQALLLTRYEDVRQVLSDPRFTRRLDAADAARITSNESGGVFGSDMAVKDIDAGEGHQRWRRLVARSFTARRIAAMRPRVEAMAEHLVDTMLAAGPPRDLLGDVGFPLPVWVICDLLGVPDSDRDRFAYWSDTLLNMTLYSQAEIDAAQAEFAAYFAEHVRAKRANPGEDLLSELIAVADADDGRLTEAEAVITGQGLLVAGHETTSNMIGKMVAMLLHDRARWQALLDDPSLVDGAVEEALRFDADPGVGMPRYLSEDVEVAGRKLPAGTTVLCSTAAANRDAHAFGHADTMDLRRSPNAHLAFGIGPHACLGQALARTELQVVLSVLLRRLPTLALAVPADRLVLREGLIVGGFEEVPVRW